MSHRYMFLAETVYALSKSMPYPATYGIMAHDDFIQSQFSHYFPAMYLEDSSLLSQCLPIVSCYLVSRNYRILTGIPRQIMILTRSHPSSDASRTMMTAL